MRLAKHILLSVNNCSVFVSIVLDFEREDENNIHLSTSGEKGGRISPATSVVGARAGQRTPAALGVRQLVVRK